jgi:transposase, IS30 family
MGHHYEHLGALERNFIQRELNLKSSRNVIAKALGRSVSTVSREIRRNGGASGQPAACGVYDAAGAGARTAERRRRGPVRLAEGSSLREHVFGQIRKGWSPQQISGRLKHMQGAEQVSHETIYQAIYVLPRGELRKQIIGLLRQGRKLRRKRANGKDRRGGLVGMVSVHERPLDVLTREIPGDWEGDLIKGAANASCIGTLVERKSRYVSLSKMKNCGADAALQGFSRALKRVPKNMLKSLTYDQGKEMARHEDLAKRLKIKVYFCDPHSPWQRPSNENTNGLIRQYLPKGIDLSIYSQKDLDRIAESLNTRPRKTLGFQTPQEVFNTEILTEPVALQI